MRFAIKQTAAAPNFGLVQCNFISCMHASLFFLYTAVSVSRVSRRWMHGMDKMLQSARIYIIIRRPSYFFHTLSLALHLHLHSAVALELDVGPASHRETRPRGKKGIDASSMHARHCCMHTRSLSSGDSGRSRCLHRPIDGSVAVAGAAALALALAAVRMRVRISHASSAYISNGDGRCMVWLIM
jgi:hypothetical protein